MEVIRLPGYTEDEKLEIAKRHLVPRQLEAHGLGLEQLRFGDPGLKRMITGYTREAGLRNLEREIAAVCRKVARRVAEGSTQPVRITPASLKRFLGAERISPDEMLRQDEVGVATGLAWTATGGDVLFVEATAMKGRGELMLTGQLGEVMKESARAALSFARSHAREFGIADDFFSSHDIHIHVPEGAIPKDGPSAGITLATSVLSVCTGQPVRRALAMTGEITLRGSVLPVGGLKEKLLAARRAGIESVILPGLNRNELDEVPARVKRGLTLHLVDGVEEVLALALVAPQASRTSRPATRGAGRTYRSRRRPAEVRGARRSPRRA
jgi:ATP-dependent Lon protease